MKFLPRSYYSVGRSKTGLGLYAEKPIKKGTLIIRYRGPKLTTEQADARDNRYMFEINSRWTIDGSPRWNTGRYVNHSCRPNSESDTRGHIVFVRAIRNIKPGDEIVYDYGRQYFNAYFKASGCLCPKCSEKRKAERAEARAKAKRKKARLEARLKKEKEAARRARKAKAGVKAKTSRKTSSKTVSKVVSKTAVKPAKAPALKKAAERVAATMRRTEADTALSRAA